MIPIDQGGGGHPLPASPAIEESRLDFGDFIRRSFGKPEVAVWSHGNSVRAGVGGRHRKLCDRAAGSDAANLSRLDLGKPEIAVGASGYSIGLGARGGDSKAGHGSSRGDLHDQVIVFVREPKVSIRSLGDLARGAGNLREEVIGGGRTCGRHADDIVSAESI